jgi:hypothetical protein
MARKHEPGHEPYSPVDAKLLQSLPSVFSAEVEEAQPGNNATSIEKQDINASLLNDKLPVQEPLNKQLKFQVSGTEMREIRRIVGQLGAELETSINWSHVARAMLVIFKHAEEEIVKQARRSEPLVRPRNSDALGLAEFEMDIAQILLKGFKAVGKL